MEETCSSVDSQKLKLRLEAEDDDNGRDKKRLKLNDTSIASSAISKFYKCPQCPYTTNGGKLMSQHLITNHKGATDPISGKRLMPKNCIIKDEEQIAKLMDKPKKVSPFTCEEPKCGVGFQLKSDMNRHMSSVHATVFKYCCMICGRLMKGRHNMYRHYIKAHPSFPYDLKKSEELMARIYAESEKTGIPPQQPSYPCPYADCKKDCKFAHLLTVHLKSHILVGKKCQFCGRMYRAAAICKIHEASHDSKLQAYECNVGECKQRFAQKVQFERHQKYSPRHNKEPQIECLKCTRKFFWPTGLHHHQKFPCPPLKDEPKYRCSTCHKPYFFKKFLQIHEQRHVDGILNLQVPPDNMKRIYVQMMNTCKDMIYVDRCNINKTEDDAKCHLIVLPCSDCPMRAIMFSSKMTPFHHIRYLLWSMTKGHACTSLHSHCEGDGHVFDISEAKFVAGGESSYVMQIVKKMVIRMAKKQDEEPIKVTNHTQYEAYHLYDDSALHKIVEIMTDEKLTSKSKDRLFCDIKSHLNGVLNEGKTVRKHPPLVFEDNIFKFLKKEDTIDTTNDSDGSSTDTEDMVDEFDEEDVPWREEFVMEDEEEV